MTTAEVGFWTAGIIYTPALGPVVDLEIGAQDSNGTNWVLKSWSGLDGPPTAGQVVQRAGDHGAYAPPQYSAARPITLTVQATATTQAGRDVARATMQQAVPVSDLALLRIDEPIPKQMYVRRSGPLTESYPTLEDVVFTVGLIAPDPRKYSTVQHSAVAIPGPTPAGLALPWAFPITFPAGSPPMSVTCTNAGSFETRPTVVIQGPVTAPQILDQVTGQTVSYTALTLGATDQLVVDFLNRQALLNGVYRPADLGSAWFTMPPGPTSIQLLGTATAGASMTVLWRDAWI